MAAFTDRGQALGAELARKLNDGGDVARLERCGVDMPLRQWVADHFREAEALVFIGAAGIAVRAIAPDIVSKTSDPAVVVVDDCGKFSISLLSGHIGGANELAEKIARLIGAEAIVTTATDAVGAFAIDTWARRTGLAIVNPEAIKTVSAKLLSGKSVAVRLAFPVAGPLPAGFVLAGIDAEADVVIDIRRPPEDRALLLAPRAAVLGVGCRKGVGSDAIETTFRGFCESTRLLPEAFDLVCSIDIKQYEPGLIEFCAKLGVPFATFAAERLMAVAGDFSASGFVAAATGADNVCERSAVLGSGGRLAARKFAMNGVTMAAAARDYAVRFFDGDGNCL